MKVVVLTFALVAAVCDASVLPAAVHAPVLAAPPVLFHHAPAPLVGHHLVAAHPAAPVFAAAAVPAAVPAYSYSYHGLAQSHPVAAPALHYVGK